LYNNTVGALVAALGGTFLVASCGSFDAGSDPAVQDGGANESSVGEAGVPDGAASVGSDGAALDGGAGPADSGLLPVVGVACGSSTCAVGQGCCHTTDSPACRAASACGGFFVTCTEASDCGSTALCCFDGARSSCAATCGGGARPLCRTSGDCAMGQCNPLACGGDAAPPITPFRLCSEAAPLAFTRAGLTCTLP
jgi:hypothetical protein